MSDKWRDDTALVLALWRIIAQGGGHLPEDLDLEQFPEDVLDRLYDGIRAWLFGKAQSLDQALDLDTGRSARAWRKQLFLSSRVCEEYERRHDGRNGSAVTDAIAQERGLSVGQVKQYLAYHREEKRRQEAAARRLIHESFVDGLRKK